MTKNDISKNSILFILEDGRIAGPQIYLLRLAKRLQLPNKIIYPFSGKKYKELLDRQKLRNSKIFISKPGFTPLKILFYILTFVPEVVYLSLYFLFSKERIIYIAGGAWQIKGLVAAKISFKKVVWHLNDTKMNALIRLIFFFLSRLADGFIFASKASENYYKDLIPRRPSSIIPSPVDFELEKNLTEPSLNFTDKTTIGMVANINPIKNLEDFIHTANKLNQKHEDLEFVIIGPIYKTQRKYYKKLKKIIMDLRIKNITFIGSVDDISAYLNSLDIFLFTSKSESSPLAVWEAMLAAKPIVTYDVGDVKEYITHLKSGYIVDLSAREDLVKGVEFLLSDFKLRSAMGREAKKVVKSELSSEACAKRHLDYFNKLL